jgi:hypothetical protein
MHKVARGGMPRLPMPRNVNGRLSSFDTCARNRLDIISGERCTRYAYRNSGRRGHREQWQVDDRLKMSGCLYAGPGWAIYGQATIRSSIVASNTPGYNCTGEVTSGYSLSTDYSCMFHNGGELNNTNPCSDRCRNNGGLTQTMALPHGSPAIDAGNPSVCTDGQGHLLKTDKHGMPRTRLGGHDRLRHGSV